MRRLPIVLALMSCSPDASTEPRVYPAIDALPELAALPDPFARFFEPGRIDTAQDWTDVRRPELIDLFAHYVYGVAPQPLAVRAEVETPDVELAGDVVHRGLRIEVAPGAPALHLALFLPRGVVRPPVFLALNPCGNHTLLEDPRVRASEAFRAIACPSERGGRSRRWPIAAITARGYALATFHESDIDPDDNDDERFADGIHPHLDTQVAAPERWGRLAAWAWGLSRVVDHLVTDPAVDGRRIIAMGHSRRGKSALLAAALDPRIALAIPHQSGTGGASPSRDTQGETVAFINAAFPGWFDDVFPAFAERESRLPVDQHLLLALVAPRPLLVTNGVEDLHADPEGALRAVRAANPVYTLLGTPGIVSGADGRPNLDGVLSWHVRDGGHDLLPEDWAVFMDYADRHLP